MGSLRQIRSNASVKLKGLESSHEWEQGEYHISLILLRHENKYYQDLTFYNTFLILRKGNATLTDFNSLTIYRYEDTVIDTTSKKFAEEEMEKVIQKAIRGGCKGIGFPSDWARIRGDDEITVLSGLL